MAEQLYFSRHTKLFLKQGSNVWEIPVMDGFSFSQATNASEVVLAEMESAAGVSRRGRTMFNDSYAPAEWSFSTYVRPFLSDTGGELEGDTAIMHAVEEPLWANFVNAYDGISTNGFTPGVTTTPGVWGTGSEGVTLAAGASIFDFTSSQSSTLGTFELWFELGNCAADDVQNSYKITDCVINSVGIDFDIDGIATVNWSGFGKELVDAGDTAPAATIVEGTSATNNFIRNRLTSLTIEAADTVAFPGAAADGIYTAVLTGGSINFENNITFLTPETLCTVNLPLAHVAGGRSIGGSFTTYLNADTAVTGDTADLWSDLAAATTVVTNAFNLVFAVGGASAPKVEFDFAQCHLEVPAHSIDDLISLEVTFSALPSSISSADEATITYTGIAL